MGKRIGPTFAAELAAAGVADAPISWGQDGVFYSEQCPAEVRAAVEAVVAAHDPAAADRAVAVQAIKLAANRDIVASYPDWKQRNMLAMAVEELMVQLKAQGIAVDETKVQPVVDAWAWIKTRRAQSDAEEAALGAGGPG